MYWGCKVKLVCGGMAYGHTVAYTTVLTVQYVAGYQSGNRMGVRLLVVHIMAGHGHGGMVCTVSDLSLLRPYCTICTVQYYDILHIRSTGLYIYISHRAVSSDSDSHSHSSSCERIAHAHGMYE